MIWTYLRVANENVQYPASLEKKKIAGFELQNFLLEMEDFFNKLSLICFSFYLQYLGR